MNAGPGGALRGALESPILNCLLHPQLHCGPTSYAVVLHARAAAGSR